MCNFNSCIYSMVQNHKNIYAESFTDPQSLCLEVRRMCTSYFCCCFFTWFCFVWLFYTQVVAISPQDINI